MDTIHFLFIFVGIDVAVNNIRVFGVAMGLQPFLSNVVELQNIFYCCQQ
jgi:hypothetical protein